LFIKPRRWRDRNVEKKEADLLKKNGTVLLLPGPTRGVELFASLMKKKKARQACTKGRGLGPCSSSKSARTIGKAWVGMMKISWEVGGAERGRLCGLQRGGIRTSVFLKGVWESAKCFRGETFTKEEK